MHEKDIEIESGENTLAGTLCLPELVGQFPAVLMIHGSGPLDRNENMKGQRLDIFNAIAHALAASGIASLRYDKRGCGKSTGNFMTSGHFDLVQDAVHCFDALAQLEQISQSKLFLLGHSEGCIIAPQISQRRSSVSGLILLCPFIEKLEDVLIRQAAQIELEIDSLATIAGFIYRALFTIVGRPSSFQQRLLQRVRATTSPVGRLAGARQPAKWLREMLELDGQLIYKSTQTPMLLIGGEHDLQCNPKDIFRIAEVTSSDTETLLIDSMTHLLKVDENPPSLLNSARLSGKPVVPTLIEKIQQWILSRPAD